MKHFTFSDRKSQKPDTGFPHPSWPCRDALPSDSVVGGWVGMMGCLVPRRECPCQAERRVREEQAAFLKKDKEEEEAEKQEESKGNRIFGFGLLRNLQKSIFGSNLNLGSVNSSNGQQPKGKRGSYRALAQEEPQGLVSPAAGEGVVSSDLEDSATSPGSMASAISAGSRMSTTGTESPVVVASRLPTTVSLRFGGRKCEENY